MSDSFTAPTGYGRVIREIVKRIDPERFDWTHFGKQDVGQPRWQSNNLEDYFKPIEQIYQESKDQRFSQDLKSFAKWYSGKFTKTTTIGGGQDGGDILTYHLNQTKPDFLFILLDLWMYNFILDKDITPTKLITYYPIDGIPVPTGCHRHLLKADYPVAMSEFGKKTTLEHEYYESTDGKYYKLSEQLQKKITVIPHGVNTKKYAPLSPKKKQEIREQEGTTDQFVIGCVSRNQPRKQMPQLYKAFAEFAKGKNNVTLHMHTDVKDPQGYNLIDLANQLKIQDKVRYTKINSYKYGLTDDEMNTVYNLFDLHTIPTTGEGFGIPIIESMSCGIPNLLTDYTTSAELIGSNWESGALIPCESLLIGSMNVYRGIPSLKYYIEYFQYFYDNPSELKKMGKEARQRALKYDWDIVVKQWESLFERAKNDKA